MKPRVVFNGTYLVPYALICAYGLFAVTTPPSPNDATVPDAAPAAIQPERATPAELANRTQDTRAARADHAETR